MYQSRILTVHLEVSVKKTNKRLKNSVFREVSEKFLVSFKQIALRSINKLYISAAFLMSGEEGVFKVGI